jgi:catechol 2,3-dioxygenase-like lactoylglutathione lyase family enzyme
MSNKYPRSLSQIAILVHDLTPALTFYTEVMDWYVIVKPTEAAEDVSEIAEMTSDISWDTFRIAHLSAADRIDVELFEFKGQINLEDIFEYLKTGRFHFCVQDPNIEELAQNIVESDGEMPLPKHSNDYPVIKPYLKIEMKDPLGNILEIYCYNHNLVHIDVSD